MKSSSNLYKVKVNPAETTLHWLWYQQCVHSPFKSFTFNISADTGLCSWLLSHSWDNRRFVRWRPEERFHVRGGSLQGRYQEYNMSRPRIKTNQFVQSDGFELVLTFPPLCFLTFLGRGKTERIGKYPIRWPGSISSLNVCPPLFQSFHHFSNIFGSCHF